MTASGLGGREQMALFPADDPRRRKVTEAADSVRHRFGDRAITRARLVGARLPAPFERDPMNPVDVRSLDAVEPAGEYGRPTPEPADDRDSLDDTTASEDRFDEA
ncbi:MAG: hypothetical protein NVS9B8_18640 [Candidatus Limnocylindrales bacterium]